MYAKLHDSIFGSSIMEEDIETRYVWFCLIAIADKDGFVDETIPALARRFNISENIMSKSVERFLQPDPASRTIDNDGRRIEPIRETFGWKIINYEKYRDMRNTEERREYMKEYMKKYRQNKTPKRKQKSLHEVNCKQMLAVLANTDTDTDTDIKEVASSDNVFITIPLINNSEHPIANSQIQEFEKLYPAVDVKQELRAIKAWNISNPKNRKTKTGILRHINIWLSKEQNRSKRNGEKERIW